MMNENVNQMIADFAKAKKIKKADLEQFVSTILEVATPVKIGRKAKASTIVLRNQLMTFNEVMREKLNVDNIKRFTAKEIADVLEAKHVDVNNTLNYFEKIGKWKRVGTAPRQEGKRGRAEVIWEFVG